MTTPIRTHISCTMIKLIVIGMKRPEKRVAVSRADGRISGDAAGVVAGVGGDDSGTQNCEISEKTIGRKTDGDADATGTRLADLAQIFLKQTVA